MKPYQTKLLFNCFILILGLLSVYTTYASSDDIRKTYALEELKILSQRIPKDYFYIQQGIRVEAAHKEILESVQHLDKVIKSLNAIPSDEEEKNLMLFLSFTRDEMKPILNAKYSSENGALVIDFGESALEGSNLLLARNRKPGEKKTSNVIKELLFNLERITKYYIAFRAGFNDYNNVQQLNKTVSLFEKDLNTVYTDKNLAESGKGYIKKLKLYWPIAKKMYLGIEKNNLPLIVFVSTDHLEKNLNSLLRLSK